MKCFRLCLLASRHRNFFNDCAEIVSGLCQPSEYRDLSVWTLVRTLALGLSLTFSTSLPAATFTVINTNDSGAGSLRQAMLDANTSAGADVIAFSIASGGSTISPTNALPAIIEPVTIDGSTQP